MFEPFMAPLAIISTIRLFHFTKSNACYDQEVDVNSLHFILSDVEESSDEDADNNTTPEPDAAPRIEQVSNPDNPDQLSIMCKYMKPAYRIPYAPPPITYVLLSLLLSAI